MTTSPILPFAMQRHRFILGKDKWHVQSIRSRRREMLLREFCLNYYLAGRTYAVDLTDGSSDDKDESAAVELRSSVRNHSESLNLLDNLEYVIKKTTAAVSSGEVSGSSRDMSMDDPSSPIDFTDSNSQCPTDNSSLIKPPLLHLGSKQKTWLDFGSDQYNFVGRMNSLPVIIHAPGKEDNSDPPIYFDVEIGGSSPTDSHQSSFRFSLGDEMVDRAADGSSSIQFTIKEGGSQSIYITWNPAGEGGLREGIRVKTLFSGTQENIAHDEIIVVGCAKKEIGDLTLKNDVEKQRDDEVVDSNKSHHFDLAQSPVGASFGKKSEDELSQDEEDSQHNPAFDASEANVEQQYDSQALSDELNGENVSLQNQTLIKPDVESATTTTVHLQQLKCTGHGSIVQNQRLAKLRAQRAVTTSGTFRERHGHRALPLRATHPLAAANRPGPAPKAKFLKYNRYTRPQTQRQANALKAQREYAQLRQAEELSLDKSRHGEEVENDELLSNEKAVEVDAAPGAAQLIQFTTDDSGMVKVAKMESQEEEFQSCQSSDSYSDLPDDIPGHGFNSPATKAMLETMVDVCVEVDAAKITPTRAPDGNRKEQNEVNSSSITDNAPSSHGEVTEIQPLDKDGVKTTNEPYVFTFDKGSSRPRTRRHSGEFIDTDDELTSPTTTIDASKSYKDATHELNELMSDQNQSSTTKRPNTPLKDLHDQINHIINTQQLVSPAERKKDFTPHPDHIIPLKLDARHIDMSSTEPYASSSNKSKRQLSLITNSLYDDTQRSAPPNTASATTSARKLYFYKSPRDKDKRLASTGQTPASPAEIGKDAPEKESEGSVSTSKGCPKNENEDSDAVSLTHENSNGQTATARAKGKSDNGSEKEQARVITNAQSKYRNSYPLQMARVDSESVYKTRVQSIRKNRSSNSLSTVGSTQSVQQQENTHKKPTSTKDAASRLYNPQQSGQPAAARTSARKLYFFKSPPQDSSKSSGPRSKPASSKAKADENGTSTPTKNNSSEKTENHLELIDKPHLPAVEPKSIRDISPPAPSLSSRERKAIEKHVQSIKNRKHESSSF